MKSGHNAGGRSELPRDERAEARDDAIEAGAVPARHSGEDPLFTLEAAPSKHLQCPGPLPVTKSQEESGTSRTPTIQGARE